MTIVKVIVTPNFGISKVKRKIANAPKTPPIDHWNATSEILLYWLIVPLMIFKISIIKKPTNKLCKVAILGVTYLPSWELIVASKVVNIPVKIASIYSIISFNFNNPLISLMHFWYFINPYIFFSNMFNVYNDF